MLETRKSAVGALRRSDVGLITIDFGVPGDPAKAFKGGWGLAHIVAKRQAEGGDGDAYARNVVPMVLAEGQVSRKYGPRRGRRIDLMLGDDQATLSLHRHGKRETWLLTAFKWGSGDRTGFVPEADLRTSPSRYSDDVGAEPDPDITPKPPPHKPSLESRATELAAEPVFSSQEQRAPILTDERWAAISTVLKRQDELRDLLQARANQFLGHGLVSVRVAPMLDPEGDPHVSSAMARRMSSAAPEVMASSSSSDEATHRTAAASLPGRASPARHTAP
ncbi:MAG TPA: hypothetical protein VMN43_05015, partial [Aestuariivirgaceae bacterium]|nr:hypothetical protein [Aestuariivirgaceae bacterium]